MSPRFVTVAGSWWMVTRRDHDQCVRCYRNARAAALMAGATGSIGASQIEQTALHDPARPGLEAPEHGATVRRITCLSVTDPDDQDGTDMPVWEGPTRSAGRALTPGCYRAVATVATDIAAADLAPCLVTVHPSGAVALTDREPPMSLTVPAAYVLRVLADRVPADLVQLFRWDNLAGNVGGITALCGSTVTGAAPTFVIGSGEDDYRSGAMLADVPVVLSRDPDPASGACDEPELVAEWPDVARMLADPDLPGMFR